MAINNRVQSLLVISVVLVSVVIGSVIQSTDTKPARIPFPHDIAGVIVSFCSPRDWFSLQRVNHVFKESLQTGIRDMFRSQKNPVKGEFRLGEYPSSNPEKYLNFVEKALDTPGMRCAVLCGELPIALINGGTILDETEKQQYLDESTEKIKEVLKSPILECGFKQLLIGRSWMAIETRNDIQMWKLDYQNQQRRLFESYPKPEGFSLDAATFGNDYKLRFIFVKRTAPMSVLTVDVQSQKSRMMKLGNVDRVFGVSKDGSSVVCTYQRNQIIVLNNPVFHPQKIDEVFEWEQVSKRFLRFELSVPDEFSWFGCEFSHDGQNVCITTMRGDTHLIDLNNGSIRRINALVVRWINEDMFQVIQPRNSGFQSLRNIQYPNIDISDDQFILDGISAGPIESFFLPSA